MMEFRYSSAFFIDTISTIGYYSGKDFVEKEHFMQEVFLSILIRSSIHPFDAMIEDSENEYSTYFFKKETENNINIESEMNDDYEDLPF